MFDVTAIVTRMEAQVPALVGRVDGAAQFAALMKSNALPTAPVSAYVLPLGLKGGRASAATGAFTQEVEEATGVVLVIRSFDQTGAKGLPRADVLIRAVIEALAGWEPFDAIGVYRLIRAQIVSLQAGTLIYQIDFALTDQLRILT